MIRLNICLSDIPQEKRVTKDGKVYTSIIVTDRKEADKFGNDQVMYFEQTKEEREAKANKIYVSGFAKSIKFK